MGQKISVDVLPKKLRDKVLVLLDDPAMTQAKITEMINTEAGKQVVSTSSISRFAIKLREDKKLANVTKTEISLLRIATALEQIATCLNKSSL